MQLFPPYYQQIFDILLFLLDKEDISSLTKISTPPIPTNAPDTAFNILCPLDPNVFENYVPYCLFVARNFRITLFATVSIG